MSDGTRKKLSGAQNKKRRLERESENGKLKGSITKFLGVKCSNPNSLSSNAEPSPTLPEQLHIDDQQPSTSTKQEDILETNTNKGNVTEAVIAVDVDFSDPATWPNPLGHRLTEIIVSKGAIQITENFPLEETGRKFLTTQYMRTLANSEKVNRDWLVYSKKVNVVFCIFCKIFSLQSHKLMFGYSNLRHLSANLSRHENSMEHLKCVQKWYELKSHLIKKCTIDQVKQKHFEMEKERWRAIIKRMICIVQYLAGQNLAFRGDSQKLYHPNNGNFLKLIEMLAKFDSVILEHLNNIRTSKQLNQNMPHYLENTFQNEFISLLSKNVQREILNCLKIAIYYPIILDGTPDASHVEQLTFGIRFVHCSSQEVEIREQFLGFFQVTNTTGEGLFTFLTKQILPKFDTDLQDIMRGQGYDNGANMSGKRVGLQTQIRMLMPEQCLCLIQPTH
ncbi:zinc finger MYM-type protein 5-like [Anthonomus grandis grandis]|uniref:zinc finger MYM-type protein 5-like n=1 Tax=Anthonomus grandis grandis TaxID=2921223 RepID=UPI0021655FA3|nr:zinc finger MYM-type protein 5-like [Anthonomus grandis grandis]